MATRENFSQSSRKYLDVTFIDLFHEDYAKVAMEEKANIAAQIAKNQWYSNGQVVTRMKPIKQ